MSSVRRRSALVAAVCVTELCLDDPADDEAVVIEAVVIVLWTVTGGSQRGRPPVRAYWQQRESMRRE